VLLIAFFIASGATRADALSFTTATYATGDGPHGVVVGDLDGDGNQDLALANTVSGDVSVLLGNGDGTFQPATAYGGGGWPYSLSLGDFDNDGDLDIAVPNNNNDDVSVLLGNGDGTFQSPVDYASGDGPHAIVAADVNNDGDLDLAVPNASNNNVAILLGNGDGTFQAPVVYGVGRNPCEIAAQDLNGDGNADLVVSNFYDDTVSVLLANGDGTFRSAVTYAAGARPVSVALGDLDHDGTLDIVASNFNSNDVSVLLGNGDGTFRSAVNYPAGGVVTNSLALGDVNGDGNPDVAVTNFSSNNVALLLGNGDGTLQGAVVYSAGPGPMCVAVEDVDGDGDHDLAVGNYYSNTVTVFLNGLIINRPPYVSAGDNIAIASEDQATTVLAGTATDPDEDALDYRWIEDANPLAEWTPVGENGEANLELGTVSLLAIGQHTLTLEASDGQAVASDQMILTIDNSAPHVAPTGGGVYEIFTPVVLGGFVSDFDGDVLAYAWTEGSTVLASGSQATAWGGDPVALPDLAFNGFDLGQHTVSLRANDGVNVEVTSDIVVEVVDTTVPTLAPAPDRTILWPPDHTMVGIAIKANASDNAGGPVTLAATVSSNEPEEGLGDGDTAPDWTEPEIDQVAGMITLQLRSERSGFGDGRTYTIVITATDESGNSSHAVVEIIVPHDGRGL